MRPWSECAAVPAAISRSRLRAAMVSASAPQIPSFALAVMRHGPMWQAGSRRRPCRTCTVDAVPGSGPRPSGPVPIAAICTISLMAGSREMCAGGLVGNRCGHQLFPCAENLLHERGRGRLAPERPPRYGQCGAPVGIAPRRRSGQAEWRPEAAARWPPPRPAQPPAARLPGTRLTISPRALAGSFTSSASAEMRPAVRTPRTVQSETMNR